LRIQHTAGTAFVYMFHSARFVSAVHAQLGGLHAGRTHMGNPRCLRYLFRLNRLLTRMHSYAPTNASRLMCSRHWCNIMHVRVHWMLLISMLPKKNWYILLCRLHAVLRPFMLRRLKESVATELPQKVGGGKADATRCACCCLATLCLGTAQL
jgi:hypothetical protein